MSEAWMSRAFWNRPCLAANKSTSHVPLPGHFLDKPEAVTAEWPKGMILACLSGGSLARLPTNGKKCFSAKQNIRAVAALAGDLGFQELGLGAGQAAPGPTAKRRFYITLPSKMDRRPRLADGPVDGVTAFHQQSQAL